MFDQLVDGRYRVLARLGSGRLGPIFEAADERNHDAGAERHVAIQLLDANLIAGRRFTGEFERGVKTLQAVWHRNIVKLFDAGRDGGRYYLITELLDSASLRFVLDDVGKLPLEETAAVVGSVGDALQYLHAKSIVHGNLKPEIVLVTFDYEVKLLDVVPPEWQAAVPGGPDVRDDVYGLACLAYEMLAGRHPYNSNTPEEAWRAGLKLTPIGLLSASQWQALAAALELQREDRTPSLAQFLDEFGVTGVQKLRALVAAEADSAAAVAMDSAPPPVPMAAPVEASTPPWLSPDVVIPERVRSAESRRSNRGGKLFALIMLAALVAAYVFRDRLGEEITAFVANVDAMVPKNATSSTPKPANEDLQKAAGATMTVPVEEPAIAVAPTGIPETDAEPADTPAATTPRADSRPAITPPVDSRPATTAPADTRPVTSQPAKVAAVPAESVAPGPPRFSFDRSPVRVGESEVAARIVIRRSGDAAQTASVAWWTEEDSAIAGRDFADLGRRTEQFEVGEKQRTVFVPLVNDSNAEPAKSFYVHLAGRGDSQPLTRVRVDIVDDD